MSEVNRFTLIILEFALASASVSCWSAAQVSKITSTAGQSVTTAKLRFPKRWSEAGEPDRTLDYVEQMEVRKIPNSPEFFFAALPDGDYDYQNELYTDKRKPHYSGNSFAVNFADKPQVRVATEGEWESGSRIVTKPRSVYVNSSDEASSEMEYRGKKYKRVGKYWGVGLLSPSGKWLALFSYSGVRRPP